MTRRLAAILAALLLAAPAGALADEVIRRFDALIEVRPDGALEVTETIEVDAEGREIRHGIYRDFPVVYRSVLSRKVVPFDVLSVRRDGADEPWSRAEGDDYDRIYIGDENRNVPPGRHTYEIRYRTDRQLRFFADHDELYWNVTGNRWAFPIERASAAVVLPAAAAAGALRAEAYTGRIGEQGRDWRAGIEDEGRAHFASTRPLPPGEGLTIVVSMPKSVVAEPGAALRLRFWLRDNPDWSLGLPGLLLLLGFYLAAWNRHGRDPAAGTIIPRFAPPAGVSPADARYLVRYGYDNRIFATILASLGVKGWLRIRDDGEQGYTIERPEGKSGAPLAAEEKVLLDGLGLRPGASLAVSQSHHEVFSATRAAVSKDLAGRHKKVHFSTNLGYFVIGTVGSVLLLVAIAVMLGRPDSQVLGALFFMPVCLGFGTLFAFMSRQAWQAARQGRRGARGRFIAMLLFAAILLLPGLIAAGALIYNVDRLAILAFLLVALNAAFFFLLRAPTPAGRKLLDELTGFRMYLDAAERDELKVRQAPDKTLRLFEAYLPYALALGVEKSWAAQFADLLGQAATETQARQSLSWYERDRSGDWGGDFLGALSGGLSDAIGSASVDPSSSGSGGGGSSGGGGGGGGGGGW